MPDQSTNVQTALTTIQAAQREADRLSQIEATEADNLRRERFRQYAEILARNTRPLNDDSRQLRELLAALAISADDVQRDLKALNRAQQFAADFREIDERQRAAGVARQAVRSELDRHNAEMKRLENVLAFHDRAHGRSMTARHGIPKLIEEHPWLVFAIDKQDIPHPKSKREPDPQPDSTPEEIEAREAANLNEHYRRARDPRYIPGHVAATDNEATKRLLAHCAADY